MKLDPALHMCNAETVSLMILWTTWNLISWRFTSVGAKPWKFPIGKRKWCSRRSHLFLV